MAESKPPYLHRFEVWIALLGAVATLVAVFVAIRSADLAKLSADRAWEMFELQRRPYIKVEYFDVTNYDRVTSVFQSIIRIRNIGQAAAIKLGVELRAGLTTEGSLKKGEDVESTPGNLGQVVLAPGDTYRFALVTATCTPRVMSRDDTASFHVRCFYTGAETHKRYYSEKMYQKFGLLPLVRPDGNSVSIMYDDAEDARTQTMGRVDAGKAIPDE